METPLRHLFENDCSAAAGLHSSNTGKEGVCRQATATTQKGGLFEDAWLLSRLRGRRQAGKQAAAQSPPNCDGSTLHLRRTSTGALSPATEVVVEAQGHPCIQRSVAHLGRCEVMLRPVGAREALVLVHGETKQARRRCAEARQPAVCESKGVCAKALDVEEGAPRDGDVTERELRLVCHVCGETNLEDLRVHQHHLYLLRQPPVQTLQLEHVACPAVREGQLHH
mmetsp:Transcript_38001/g.88810  ORF Transcript_38001/g.88810 Transcript_38001/m.88810 type:complete len:225 (+) Transcript_38001:436-1110(+)